MISVLFVALLVGVLLPIAYFPLSPSVKECQKLIMICRSYVQISSGMFFFFDSECSCDENTHWYHFAAGS